MKETSLFEAPPEAPQKPAGPVTCLGLTFDTEEDRRAHFTEGGNDASVDGLHIGEVEDGEFLVGAQ